MIIKEYSDGADDGKDSKSVKTADDSFELLNDKCYDGLREQNSRNKHVHPEDELPDKFAESLELPVKNAESLEEDIRREHEEITYDTKDSGVDGGWGWFIVMGAIVLRLVIGGIGRSHGLFYVKFKERFGGSATATALVTSLTAFIRLSGGPIVSILSGRFQIRILTSIGSVTLFLGLILTAFASSLQFLYFSYGIVTGIGRALSLTAVPILLGYYFDKRRSLAFGLASTGFSIGGFAITPIVELMFQHFGYQGTFIILSGFALNILVSASLFRPIELQRRLLARDRKTRSKHTDDVRTILLSNSDEAKKNGDIIVPRGTRDDATEKENGDQILNEMFDRRIETSASSIINLTDGENGKQTSQIDKQNCEDIAAMIVQNTNPDIGNERYDKLTSSSETYNGKMASNDLKDDSPKNVTTKLNDEHLRKKYEDKKKKKALISWSILKDGRFLCFVFATFCFTLPSSGLFLPALAKSKGVSEIQAATLLSNGAGFDTVFRILSGVILDLRCFRSIRPQIYNGITFIQATLSALYPFMASFEEFMVLTAADGAVQGIKAAQGSVIMMDMLGVDKFASSLAVTMTVQCVAVFLGPTISGRLIDSSDSYNGAFYFASSAIFLGAIVMAGGNIAKHYRDSKSSSKDKHRNK